jgi:cytochrome c oxidase assembly protein subunit 11
MHSVDQLTIANRRLGLRLLTVIATSLLFVAAQPSLYKAFCEWTGFNSIDRADKLARNALAGRPLRLEFDANSFDNGLHFSPEVATMAAKTGELLNVTYRVENTSAGAVSGRAVVSYAPRTATEYIVKVACFCFTQQTFAPHEVRELPVVFMIDPNFPTDVSTVTLSYTFFEASAPPALATSVNPKAAL